MVTPPDFLHTAEYTIVAPPDCDCEELAEIVAEHAKEIVTLRAMITGRDRGFKLELRHAHLMIVGALERDLGISPTTKELRDKAK